MKSHIHRIREELPLVLLFLATIWGVFLLDRILPLERLGLIPRDLGGLIGIVTMPFLHSNFTHLLNNTVPLAVLLTLLAGSRTDSRAAVALVAVVGGVLLWLFGRGHSLHIGASGLVFGLAVFLIVSGALERRIVPLLVSAFVAFTYGTTLLTGISPWQAGVSWDGHLLGGVAGGLVAWLLVRKTPAA
ncbi:rhomboid family intramembrane serine protease [Thiothrix winogradskyi]|uniref:Rhomboid family intramembrane serine protease n=1 Tax=Thiothrix winogradskyi TaxID=96472 RepID=A0ABY3SYJ2_9GAMM|nr:rhomboid family intramembrane serine protease [Thiothrix winogradskyi]UJS24568.1 rhomboid family intramembrane serine protease [Thiothrix winogradskyi]